MYLPSRHPVHAFKKAIRAACGKQTKESGAIEIGINVWFARPKSQVWKTKPMPWYYHIKKPDIDNIVKAVLDALNGLAWTDDAQISSVKARKFVCGDDMEPRTEILIRSLHR